MIIAVIFTVQGILSGGALLYIRHREIKTYGS